MMGKVKTIDSYFKRKIVVDEEIEKVNHENKRHKALTSETEKHGNQEEHGTCEDPPSNTNEVDLNHLERDPGKRKPIWDYPVSLRKEVRRAYLNLGPFQVHLKEYPRSRKYPRRFKHSWFSIFPSWLEYSPTTDASYCLLCYLFSDKSNVSNGHDAFTVKGFDSWKKVNGKNCAYLMHMGSSRHRNAVEFSQNLLNQTTHIENIMTKQSEEQILKNRMQQMDSQLVKISSE